MITETPPWSVIITKPNCEEVAERSLRQTGYRAYFPRYRKLLLPHGRQRQSATSMRPLFQGMLFVQDWNGWPKYWITGIIGLMRRNGTLTRISDEDIRIMMDRERLREFDDVIYSPVGAVIRDDLIVGADYEVDVLGKRVIGVLEQLSDNGKAIVRDMLGTAWTVSATQLAEAPVAALGIAARKA